MTVAVQAANKVGVVQARKFVTILSSLTIREVVYNATTVANDEDEFRVIFNDAQEHMCIAYVFNRTANENETYWVGTSPEICKERTSEFGFNPDNYLQYRSGSIFSLKKSFQVIAVYDVRIAAFYGHAITTRDLQVAVKKIPCDPPEVVVLQLPRSEFYKSEDFSIRVIDAFWNSKENCRLTSEVYMHWEIYLVQPSGTSACGGKHCTRMTQKLLVDGMTITPPSIDFWRGVLDYGEWQVASTSHSL